MRGKLEPNKPRIKRIIDRAVTFTALVTISFALAGLILGFWFFFKGIHEVDLYVNRAILFNEVNQALNEPLLDIAGVNETGINIITGEQSTITNTQLYITGMRTELLGVVMIFTSAMIFSATFQWFLGRKDEHKM